MLGFFILFLVFLCWGSFLNVIAYRLIHVEFILKQRSFCPQCKNILPWFDLIPIISWFFLKGRCRFCDQRISFLYPLLELLTAVTLTMLVVIASPCYVPTYILFFSALLVTIRTDLETMLISRYATIFLVPFAFLLSYFHRLPLSPLQSIAGTIVGYFLLWSINKLFFVVTKKEGMGQGDMDLLALIGAFTGSMGAWITIVIGSIIGSIIGIPILVIRKESLSLKIPFGPFLAMGAMTYVLFENTIIKFLIL